MDIRRTLAGAAGAAAAAATIGIGVNVAAYQAPDRPAAYPAVADLAPLIPSGVAEPAIEALWGSCDWYASSDLGPLQLRTGDPVWDLDAVIDLCDPS